MCKLQASRPKVEEAFLCSPHPLSHLKDFSQPGCMRFEAAHKLPLYKALPEISCSRKRIRKRILHSEEKCHPWNSSEYFGRNRMSLRSGYTWLNMRPKSHLVQELSPTKKMWHTAWRCNFSRQPVDHTEWWSYWSVNSRHCPPSPIGPKCRIFKLLPNILTFYNLS